MEPIDQAHALVATGDAGTRRETVKQVLDVLSAAGSYDAPAGAYWLLVGSMPRSARSAPTSMPPEGDLPVGSGHFAINDGPDTAERRDTESGAHRQRHGSQAF